MSYQNKIDDFAISSIFVIPKNSAWYAGNFGISPFLVLLKKSYRHTDNGFNTGIVGISVYLTALSGSTIKVYTILIHGKSGKSQIQQFYIQYIYRNSVCIYRIHIQYKFQNVYFTKLRKCSVLICTRM